MAPTSAAAPARIGAEICGLRIGGDLQPATVRAIRQALLEHKVIFFRNQYHLTDRMLEAFAALLGNPVAHPTVPVAEKTQYVFNIDSTHGKADSWHTDVTFVDAYPQVSILRSVVLPELGGDTIWANTEATYENLPEPLKQLADGLSAVHSNQYDYGARAPTISPENQKHHEEAFTSTVYETEHPVVRVHPETGKRLLVLGHFVKRLIGLPGPDSRVIFDLLQNYVTAEDNTVRWSWRMGDVAIWDNRATQHKAIDDYGSLRRTTHRVTIAGNLPVGVDGRPSRTLTTQARNAEKRAA